MSACPACASDVAAASRFCFSCGAALDGRFETPTGTAPRGTPSVAAFSLAVSLVVWALGADHLPEFNRELSLVMRGLAGALLNACLTGLLYLALEPYVRRLWPDALISWTRLMAGRWRDPLVGAHVLMGMVYGTATALLIVAVNHALWALGTPKTFAHTFSLDMLLGPDQTLMFVLDRLVDSVTMGMGTVLLFVGMRFLLKRQWLAAVAVTAVSALPDAFSSGTNPWLAVPVTMLVTGMFVAALIREGLLTVITTLFGVGLIVNFPLSLELGQWYSMPTKTAFAMVAALAVYGLNATLRQPPLARGYEQAGSG